MQPTTAILFFSRTATTEHVNKPLLQNSAHNLSLFKALVSGSLHMLNELPFDVYHISEKQQVGKSFAQRFKNALQSVFDLGYQRVISIGNDAPQLKANHILKANRLLNEQDLVLGPTFQGGFYLMGFTKLGFTNFPFIDLSWQTRRLFTQVEQLYATNQCALLPYIHELNQAIDLKPTSKKVSWLFYWLYDILIVKITYCFDVLFDDINISKLTNKAPPVQ